MLTNYREEPLHRYPVARTRDPEVMREALLTRYGATSCHIPHDPAFFGRANFIEHAATSVGFCSYGSEAVADFPASDYVRLQIGLKGFASTTSAGVATEIRPEIGCISSPNQNATLRFGRGYEQLVLRIRNATLEERLARMIGFRPKGALRFDAALRTDLPQGDSLRQLVMFFASQLQQHATALPPLVVAELEHAITVAFLLACRHNFSGLLEADARNGAPKHVRIAEEFIEAHWNQPITIEKLADQTDVSSRTLLRAFLKYRGYTPHAFLKQTRLNRSKQILERGAPATSVTSVAYACGFGNPGHFAKDYRVAFGELPSDTLDRAKGR
jgi:AraC-like DNA-binding protein